MSAEIIAEKYANALFESVKAAGTLASTATEIESISKVFGEKSSLDFFSSPFNSLDQRVSSAKASLEGKVSAEVFNFVSTLVKNERIHLINEISQIFKVKAAQVGEQAEGTLYVVDQPSAEFKNALEKKVSAILKKDVRLQIETDKNLISGFKVQVEGWTLDDSVLHHLKKLTDSISTRGL